MLDREEELLQAGTHPDYIQRMSSIELKHGRRMAALEERRRQEEHRAREMARVERESVLRWFMVGFGVVTAFFLSSFLR